MQRTLSNTRPLMGQATRRKKVGTSVSVRKHNIAEGTNAVLRPHALTRGLQHGQQPLARNVLARGIGEVHEQQHAPP